MTRAQLIQFGKSFLTNGNSPLDAINFVFTRHFPRLKEKIVFSIHLTKKFNNVVIYRF